MARNETIYTPILKKYRKKKMLSLLIWHPADQKITKNIKDLSVELKDYHFLKKKFNLLKNNLLKIRGLQIVKKCVYLK